LRRGSAVHTNKNGLTLCYPSANAPVRQGWGPAAPEPFYDQVEE